MSLYYDPDGNPISMEEWRVLFEKRHLRDENTMLKTEIGDVNVSTVWLGLDHSFGSGPPLIWETMIFGGLHDEACWRYATREEALQGHREAILLARRGIEEERRTIEDVERMTQNAAMNRTTNEQNTDGDNNG